MTSESKILTVSYGTFSCTLEGFDDPFNTMKAIAEYFRDLAAEDRYFGAEPPQPDAAMLHRIAEREVARLVEARVREDGVAQRPHDDGLPLAARAERTAGAMDREELAQKAQEAFTPDRSEDSAEPTLQDVIPNGVAAKLARIRRSVNPGAYMPPISDEALQSFSAEDEGIAADIEITAEPVEELEAFHTGPVEAAEAAPAEDVLSRLGALITDPVAEVEAVEEIGEEADAFFDDERVVGTEAAPMPEHPATAFAAFDPQNLFAEPPVEAFAPENEWEVVVLDAEEVEEIVAEFVDDQPFMADAPQEATAEVALAAEPDAEAEGDLVAAAEDLPANLPAVLSDALPEVIAAEIALTEALAEDPVPESLEAEAETEGPVAEAPPEPEVAPVEEPAAPSKTAGKTKRVNSRVVRIHPDGDGAAPDRRPDPNQTRILRPSGADSEVARLLRQADDVMADADNRRRLDSIAHLKAAVVATEADRAVTGEAKPPAGAKTEPYRDDLAQVVQPDPEPAPVEVKPRRKTVSVRPQEPRPGTIRPGMVGPTPLVLVSEQRIDRLPPAQAPVPDGQPLVALRTGRLTGVIGAAAASPSMPQQKLVLERPSHGASAEADDEEEFDDDLTEADEAGLASFAERVGVRSMADMLEAAAAYATCIEQRGEFTRPQLMRRLMASAGGKPVSREDGLRSFGTLLRTGRIEKVSRGHYTLADSSPYLTEARRFS